MSLNPNKLHLARPLLPLDVQFAPGQFPPPPAEMDPAVELATLAVLDLYPPIAGLNEGHPEQKPPIKSLKIHSQQGKVIIICPNVDSTPGNHPTPPPPTQHNLLCGSFAIDSNK